MWGISNDTRNYVARFLGIHDIVNQMKLTTFSRDKLFRNQIIAQMEKYINTNEIHGHNVITLSMKHKFIKGLKLLITQSGKYCNTLVPLAIAENNILLVKCLVENGATELDWFIYKGVQYNNIEIVTYLVEKKNERWLIYSEKYLKKSNTK